MTTPSGKLLGRKAVLVYPRFETDTFWSFERTFQLYVPKASTGLPKRSLPPLGLMGLYGYIKQFYEDIELVDRNVDPRDLQDILLGEPDVWMGGMIAQEKGFQKDAQIVKELGLRLIAGGTMVDEHSWLMDAADHLVENEAENVIDDLIAGLYDRSAEKLYRGTAAGTQFFKPDFTAINLDDYSSMAIQISRGCPWACEFCDITTRFGRKMRHAPDEDIEDAFQQMFDLGWRGPLFIVDDNFIGSPKGAVEILQKIDAIERRLGYRFRKYTELSMNLADENGDMPELRRLFKETNWIDAFIGVETSDPKALVETRKLQNLKGEKSIQDKLEFLTEETGFNIMAGMIYGFDADTSDSVETQIEFINSTHVPTMMVGLMIALPHTELWERLSKEGRLRDKTGGNNTDGTINFIPYNLSAKEAEGNYVKILEGVYAPDAYFGRVLRAIELADPIDKGSSRSFKEGVYSVSRILTRENAGHYWRHLPTAHRIAKQRFGTNTEGYWFVMGEYFEHCARYSHMRTQVKKIKQRVEDRQYEPWQLYSWKDIQDAKVESITVTEEGDNFLNQRVLMKLDNGYEFNGLRLDAIRHFSGPHLKAGLLKLSQKEGTIKPADYRQVETNAYTQVCLQRPAILEGHDDVENLQDYFHAELQGQSPYVLRRMMQTIRKLEQLDVPAGQ